MSKSTEVDFKLLPYSSCFLHLSFSVLLVWGPNCMVPGEQRRKPGTKCGGTSWQGAWGTEVPQWGPRTKPLGGLGDEVPQKLKQFWISICIILTEFLNTQYN